MRLEIDVPRAFLPLLAPVRYKDAVGGRGSGKSHHFAEKMVAEAVSRQGYRAVCVREVMKDLSESSKLLLEDKIKRLGVAGAFDCQRDKIVTPGNGLIIFRGMRDYNAESIKSLEGFDRAWVEEAQSLSERSLSLLRPTIRAPGSEIWFSRNRRFPTDAVDAFIAKALAAGDKEVVSVTANWRDNPFWTDELEAERLRDQRDRPEEYGHIWEGEYFSALKSSYFGAALLQARQEGRIGVVAADPLMSLRAYWDIGGSGAKADATAIWVCQFVRREVRVLDYYEAVGQPLGEHLHWLREKGYGRALCVLPHDGANHEKVHRVTYEGAIRDAGFDVRTVPNAGTGAAMRRVEAVRRLFPSIWFNEATCEAGLNALAWYHERRDPIRNIGLGPEHDWASHAADAFGLLAVDYEAPSPGGKRPQRAVSTGWII